MQAHCRASRPFEKIKKIKKELCRVPDRGHSAYPLTVNPARPRTPHKRTQRTHSIDTCRDHPTPSRRRPRRRARRLPPPASPPPLHPPAAPSRSSASPSRPRRATPTAAPPGGATPPTPTAPAAARPPSGAGIGTESSRIRPHLLVVAGKEALTLLD